ncbi:type II toxin-antitoxin system toxin DNA ADP-ribosyl transferase DarT [Jeotgalibacillus terrae]|uniref:DUF4433 domain-containing protein n=1 Tax=Jeotgalibacillus terrae TaxID=587735 RepID=A0ABW5ZH56_9BACL|nr:DUF4433 domain-containing protein [Jeotgalibacillus terrae]MBM7578533.1 hypothetical protein [Jeotgalibacillus terrae]
MKNRRLLYHLTHINNLISIFSNQGLLSYSEVIKRDKEYKDVADQGIQIQRSSTIVPISPGGSLHDYVPFYFAGRSPMLYRLSHNGFHQKELVYLMTNTEKVKDSRLPFVFTDGHAIMFLTEFYNNLEFLNKIDWDVMESKYWSDTDEDPDRKRRRQAEFLIHQQVLMKDITGIAVYSEDTKLYVEELLQKEQIIKPVIVVKEYYY